jgi:hypothetical protein
MGDNMDRLEESSAGWADDVSKLVNQQKRKAVMGCKFSFCSDRKCANAVGSDYEQVRVLRLCKVRTE